MELTRRLSETDAVRFHTQVDEVECNGDNSVAAASSTDHGKYIASSNSSSAAPRRQLARAYFSARASAVPPAEPLTAELCFADGFLAEPLLQDRGASSSAAQHLFGTPPPRLTIEWNGITQYVPAPTAADPKARKRILCNVSGRAYPGETLAIMGPSGSGKTSLLSLLGGGWRKARDAGHFGELLDCEKH